MWHRFPAFIRDWSILIVGMLLIMPMMYFASPYNYHLVVAGNTILGNYIQVGGYCGEVPYCTGSLIGKGTATFIYGTGLQ